ncbi:hypothetical protein C8P67_11719 [Flavobacterium aquicola]|uniref:Uncharacterized protein n=1 Tax=Flavobacterium aquicola TaxID=1682742 RepID=A0A3E0E2F6_9FLAO|nr:hypothetical protein C8P67_11719 [Flavobacterium aquicola]
MKNLIIIILLFNSLCSFGQNHLAKSKLLKSKHIKIDSIEVQVSIYEYGEIVTESYFEKSKSKLSVAYLKFAKSSYKISTRENSLMPEDFWRTNEFDFENGKVLNGKERFHFSGKMSGIFGKTDKEYRESFNKSLNSEFVEKYVVELFEKIKNYR